MAANKVIVNNQTILDLTADTVTAAMLKKGVTAHDARGGQITGTLETDYVLPPATSDKLGDIRQ